MKASTAARFALMPAVLIVLVNCQRDCFGDEWVAVGPPAITNSLIQTVGGITYFTHTSVLQGCSQIASGPVMQSGTNLIQTINRETWDGICVCNTLVCPPFAETHVSVLGNLSPGDYSLQVYSVPPAGPIWNPPDQTNLFVVKTFTVTNAVQEKVGASIDGDTFTISVPGVSGVWYTIESTSDCTNWLPVISSDGGPFTWSEPVSSADQRRLYRVRIEGQ